MLNDEILRVGFCRKWLSPLGTIYSVTEVGSLLNVYLKLIQEPSHTHRFSGVKKRLRADRNQCRVQLFLCHRAAFLQFVIRRQKS